MPLLSKIFYQKVLDFAGEQYRSLKTKDLYTFQNQLSIAYRNRQPTSILKSIEAIGAYAIARMPATYHAVQACYQQLPTDFQPQSLLDLGAGPGTASLAALDFWPSLKQLTLVENHKVMYAFQKILWQYLNPPLSYHSVHDTIHPLGNLPQESFDLVVLAYVLGEIKPYNHQEVILQAWQKAAKYLLIVTPGTPHDFKYLLKARDLLLSKGAVIAAPCTHQLNCPLTNTEDWCHFSVRLQRSSLHQSAKKATLGYEDEKFSYLLFSRSASSLPLTQGRIVRKPIRRSGHILLDVCVEGQLKRQIIGKSGHNLKKASKIEWGDLILYPS